MVLRLRRKGTFSTCLLKSTFSLASRTSMVTFIVCLSVARKIAEDEVVGAPTAVEMFREPFG